MWIVELFTKPDSAANAVAVIMLVAALGMVLGSIRLFGVSLGIGGVLFSGLLFGHFKVTINHEMMEFCREFGLILFVYTIGMQVGPGFMASLRRQGLPLNLMAASIVILGALITAAFSLFFGLTMPVAAGLFAGATTNTPALAAAQQALKDVSGAAPELAKLPGLSYAVAYPFGIIGIILTMIGIRTIFRINAHEEATHMLHLETQNVPKPSTINLQVQNPNLEGLALERVPRDTGVVISRVMHSEQVQVAQPDTVLHVGDVLLAVGPTTALEELRLVVGCESQLDLRSVPCLIQTKRVIVTHREAVGCTIDELNLCDQYDVAVTRVNRAGVEFTPTENLRLQFGDRLLVVGEEHAIEKASERLGNSAKQLDFPQMIPMLVGISLGVILGSYPFWLPAVPAPVRLGLAGGPLIVAIILSRIGNIGPLVWYLPPSANLMLRELGITLFLACVGLRAGDQFVRTLTQGDGFLWMGFGVVVTLLPLLIVSLVARAILKLNYAALCGMLAGGMTDPPALSFAGTITSSDAPYITYAQVYPLTVILRVLCAQALVLFLPQGPG